MTTRPEPSWLRCHWFDVGFFVVAVGLIATGLSAVGLPLPDGCNFHYASQFGAATTPTTTTPTAPTPKPVGYEALAKPACDSLKLGDAHRTLEYDWIFVAVYGALFAYGNWRFWRSWRVKRLRRLRAGAVALGVAAALADALENALTWWGMYVGDSRVTYRSNSWAAWVSGVALLKWLLFIAAAAAFVAGFWATIAPRAHGLPEPSPPDPTDPPDRLNPEAAVPLELGAEVGVCCSGGGIRAAAYTVGALEQLEEAGVMDDARWLTGVSGGGYAATGWTLRRHAAVENAAVEMQDHLLSGGNNPPHKYLASGHGGLALALLRGLAVIAFNIAAIALAVVTVAWPLGRVLSSAAVQPELSRIPLPSVRDFTLSTRHYVPGLVLLGLALAVLLFRAVLPAGGSLATTAIAKGIAALGVIHLTMFVALPYAIGAVHEGLTADGLKSLKALLPASVLAVLAAIWKALSNKFGKYLPRLGGVALGVIVFVAASVVATRAAHDSFSVKLWAVLAVVFVVLFCGLPIQWASLRPLYRDGLRRAFARWPAEGGGFEEMGTVEWSQLPAPTPSKAGNLPELVICAASQQMGLASGGIPATSLTISRQAVRAHLDGAPAGGDALPTGDYLSAVPLPFQREVKTLSAWMALTGAAFSSAMGRGGYGTTNALMAAFNIDLGAWLPNPRLVGQGATKFRRIRLGYLVKEVFGLYDSNDQNVFVSDGGQWENLGLVELLRRRCKTIVCLDASGDKPGTFTTLRQAIDLAARALPFKIDIEYDLKSLKGVDDALPATSTACWNLTYKSVAGIPETKGLLLYAKLQVAADQPSEIVQFASRDRTFPHYSTANQFLETTQVAQLIGTGSFAGSQLAAMGTWLRAVGPI